jgi:23S rRNA (cytosine1962-C5)-methyltransferase
VRPAYFPPGEFPAWELVDSGDGWKLERVGGVCVARPDPQALWPKRLDARAWEAADLAFVRENDRGGRWESRGPRRREWHVDYRRARFVVRPTSFKHLGLFPEQATNWEWVAERAPALAPKPERARLLNLFGYTGAASVLATQAGYAVTHVDASKTSVAWALENARASGLAEKAWRVLVEDALQFARREGRRGARYEAILLDPPHHGRGPRGETWQFEEHAAALLDAAARLLAPRALVVLSSYAFGTSPLALAGLIESLLPAGELEAGELALPHAQDERLLPCGFCARWSRGVERGGAA